MKALYGLGVAFALACALSVTTQAQCDPNYQSCPPPPVVYDDCGCSINYQSCPPCEPKKEENPCDAWFGYKCDIIAWFKWINEVF
jgi:hypothetical protein